MSRVSVKIGRSSPRQYLCAFLGALKRKYSIEHNTVGKCVRYVRPYLLRNKEVMLQLLLQLSSGRREHVIRFKWLSELRTLQFIPGQCRPKTDVELWNYPAIGSCYWAVGLCNRPTRLGRRKLLCQPSFWHQRSQD